MPNFILLQCQDDTWLQTCRVLNLSPNFFAGATGTRANGTQQVQVRRRYSEASRAETPPSMLTIAELSACAQSISTDKDVLSGLVCSLQRFMRSTKYYVCHLLTHLPCRNHEMRSKTEHMPTAPTMKVEKTKERNLKRTPSCPMSQQ